MHTSYKHTHKYIYACMHACIHQCVISPKKGGGPVVECMLARVIYKVLIQGRLVQPPGKSHPGIHTYTHIVKTVKTNLSDWLTSEMAESLSRERRIACLSLPSPGGSSTVTWSECIEWQALSILQFPTVQEDMRCNEVQLSHAMRQRGCNVRNLDIQHNLLWLNDWY